MKKSIHKTCQIFCLIALCSAVTSDLFAQRAVWEGEEALKEHRQKLYEKQAANTSRSQSDGTNTSSNPSANTGSRVSNPPSSANTATTREKSMPEALTTEQIKTARAAAQKARAERKLKALEKPFIVTWPTTPQPELSWERADEEFDSYTVSKTTLRTTKNLLMSETLVGYHPSSEPSPHTGLTLVNRVRSDLHVDYYTFHRDSLLPDLEADSIEAYINALPEVFAGKTIQPIDLDEAKSTYGPSAADLNTRRITYRLVEENGTNGERVVEAVVTDYLLPFEDEWLVVRFTAPPRLYESARAPIESYLLNMYIGDSGPEFSSL